MSSAPSEVTRLLQRWTAGDAQARDQLIPLVYDRLRQLAHWRLRSGPGEHSLNTTGLVHEAYIRLVDPPQVDLPDRAHFLALASQIMRNLLVDRARARAAAKRGGGKAPLEPAGGAERDQPRVAPGRRVPAGGRCRGWSTAGAARRRLPLPRHSHTRFP